MALKKLAGLAALGGFLYVHKKRGGQLSLDSFKETARSLVDDVKGRAQDIKEKAEHKLNENRTSGDFGSTQSTQQTTTVGEDVTGYGSAGYGYGSNDLNRR